MSSQTPATPPITVTDQAWVEHCFTTMHTGKASWEGVFESIRRAGPERCILSTDLGQTINPPVSEGFALFAQKLLDAGFYGCGNSAHGSDESGRMGRIGNPWKTRRQFWW
jgi:hypothetical protein